MIDTKSFFAMMIQIMRVAWATFATLKIDGIAVTSIILVFLCICILLGIFWGRRAG